MNDVSRLSGASPVSPTSNRVWKSPRKQKPGERSGRNRHDDHLKEEEDGRRDTAQPNEPQVPETEEPEDPGDGGDPLSYGTAGLKKSRNHKVDLVI